MVIIEQKQENDTIASTQIKNITFQITNIVDGKIEYIFEIYLMTNYNWAWSIDDFPAEP